MGSLTRGIFKKVEYIDTKSRKVVLPGAGDGANMERLVKGTNFQL